MKKFISLTAFALLTTTLSFSLVACGDDDDDNKGGGSKFEKQTFTINNVSFTMIPVEGGSFMMGAPDTDTEASEIEKPQHKVTLSDFYIGEVLVTQALWKAVMGDNPFSPKGSLLPANCISWEDCQTFIAELNKQTGKEFRLPTEAEWEYAARGGKKTKGYKYAGSDNLDEVAWYVDNAPENFNPNVAQKKPNELGLYDMTGYVWEWCQDWFAEDFYSNSPQQNPCNTTSGTNRVLRGGDRIQSPKFCRVTQRNKKEPDITYLYFGLRLAMNR